MDCSCVSMPSKEMYWFLAQTPSYIQLSSIQPLYLDCRWILVKYWRLFNEIVMLSSWNVYILFKRYSWELLSCNYCVHGLVCSLVTSIFIFVDQNLVYMYHSMIEKYKIKEFKILIALFMNWSIVNVSYCCNSLQYQCKTGTFNDMIWYKTLSCLVLLLNTHTIMQQL